MTESLMHDHLIPECQSRAGDDPIFALNAEARKRAAAGESILNATLGTLMDDEGNIAVVPSVFEAIAAVPPERGAAYAPIAGEPRYLKAIVSDLFGDGPLASRSIAVATPGGTGALYHAVVNFLQPGDALLTTSFFWGPYKTIADHTGRRVETFPMFDDAGGFDASSLQNALLKQMDKQGRALVIVNSPCHNPTGYALDADDWSAVAKGLSAAAKKGPVALLVDFAYARFDAGDPMRWLKQVEPLLDDVLLLIAWSGSKAFTQYGARIGAIVATCNDDEKRKRIRDALAFACRGTWSNCNHLGMLAVTEILEDPAKRKRADAEREELRALLFERVAIFNEKAKAAGLRYPRYEGGFFVTVFSDEPKELAARMRDKGVFVVPIAGAVRIALCSTRSKDVPRLVDALAG